MTAESLKPFITLPSAENCSSHKRSPHNLIAIGLSASFVILSIVLLGFTIWNTIRVGELQKEVTTLNKVIGHMQKRLGFDYLEEYENEYGDNVLVDDPNPYSQDNDDDDEDDGDGDDDDDDDDGDSDEGEDIKGIPAILDYEDDDILDGSGLYDDENDDDDDDDNIDDSSYDSGFDGFVETDDDVDPKKERKTRSISSSSNGIPIYADSYALKRNRTGGPEDERIEHHLLANKSPTPTLRYDWSEKATRPPPSTESSVPEHRGRYESAPNNMLRSLNPPRRRLHRRYRNQQLLRPLLKSGKIRGKHQAIRAISMPQLTAVHYHLNNTLSGKHNLHPDHNKLPHDGDVYIGSPHPWARTLGMDKSFELNHGLLTVKEAGLYFIYAQIFYDNHYDRNGFVVYHNVHPFLQCALFIPTNTIKTHTCYTSGVIYLESDDQLHLRDIHRDRTVMLTNAKSFFGIIKLGEI